MTAHFYKRSLGTFAILFAAGLFAASCSKSSNPAAPTPPAPTPTVSSVVVTGTSTPGVPFQMTATARMTDNTTQNVTSTSAWLSSNAVVATVSSTGMVTVVGGGQFVVQATFQNVSGSLQLMTANLPVVAVTVEGPSTSTVPFQLTAIARLSDGSQQDVTQLSHWQSSATQFATVTTTGYVSVVSAGDVDFLATYNGVVGSLSVTVGAPVTFQLSGVVTSKALGVGPIEGARVQVFAGSIVHVDSDARGLFTLRITSGSAIVEVSKDGYDTWSALVDVGRDTTLAVVLVPTALAAVK